MSDTYIPAALRRFVAARAEWRCEYCGIAEADTWFGCEVDHIVSEKHGGRTEAENLALACLPCNRHKGSDVATVREDGTVIELFHPRRHPWDGHFKAEGLHLAGRTEVGQATVRLLRMNLPERLEERRWSARQGSD